MDVVKAIKDGDTKYFIYLGGEDSFNDNIENCIKGGLKETFDEYNYGLLFLILAYLYENYCGKNAENELSENDESWLELRRACPLIKNYVSKWFDRALPYLLNNKYFEYISCDWIDKTDEQVEYFCKSENVTIVFDEPMLLAEFPIFLKVEFYEEFKNDINDLYKNIFGHYPNWMED